MILYYFGFMTFMMFRVFVHIAQSFRLLVSLEQKQQQQKPGLISEDTSLYWNSTDHSLNFGGGEFKIQHMPRDTTNTSYLVIKALSVNGTDYDTKISVQRST
jgi:hypothetical protein